MLVLTLHEVEWFHVLKKWMVLKRGVENLIGFGAVMPEDDHKISLIRK